MAYPRPLESGFLDRWLKLQEELQVLLERKVDLVLGDSINDPYLNLTIDEDKELMFED